MWRKQDYWFELPEEQIAQKPLAKRLSSKLLVVERDLRDATTAELEHLIPENAVLVLNNTKVVPARLQTKKQTGGKVEVFILRPFETGGEFECLIKPARRLKEGSILSVADETLSVAAMPNDKGIAKVSYTGDMLVLLESHGAMPLPPYIDRQKGPTSEDRERYQTVFAKHAGAVAAPTASLHLTDELLQALAKRGVDIAWVTLHVGLGTFQPMRGEDIREHELHEEWYQVPEETARLCNQQRPVVAVGTTVVRSLESAWQDGKVVAKTGNTGLYIRPGFHFHVVDHLLTNFHLPGSSLLVLVATFGGHDRVMSAYQHAVSRDYRFYSYGDAMLISRSQS